MVGFPKSGHKINDNAVYIVLVLMHLSMYSPTTPPGLSGALLGALTQKHCPTMGHMTKT